jgi:SOS-response transcriptional repressor LexA/DNA-binding XRE family transcriptional regulator
MVELEERLKRLRFELGLKQGEFADRIEMSQGMLSDIEHGNRPLTDRNIKLICLEFGANREWLVGGQGPMFAKKPAARENPLPNIPVIGPDGQPLEGDEAELIKIYRELEEPTQEKVLTYAHDMIDAQGYHARDKMKGGAESAAYPEQLPLSLEIRDPAPDYEPELDYPQPLPTDEGFSNVVSIDYDMVGVRYFEAATAAGKMKDMEEDPEGRRLYYLPRNALKADPENCFCVPIHGVSMTQAGISDGDTGVFQWIEEPENGEIMLVSYEDGSTVKRVRIRENRVFLCWEDGSGEEIEVQKEGYRVIGKLLSVLKNPVQK